ncbi:sporulation protein YtfJ [Syntrophobotulus glycolicus DSM 8271]|uniref:Sporulation protein YtfJ n=1 Tax=Syntrophobotulus glycolicus (strain DSM 8271 / FlGlyR) TaxID=645991 RepID=F0SYE0_SYNGF|nr:GerW family sporulation protein [Syntrophobotulus glycolicus]ADY55975.1 sporulation protein YtfJ [Syntrophobotulus glycolicus DSM 8271]
MDEHPIETLMKTAMESIQKMINVNTVIGEPVETQQGSVIIPISRVSCGFAAGGSEFTSLEEKEEVLKSKDQNQEKLPFGGGSGAGVSVKPVGFLVVNSEQIRMLPVEGNVVMDRIIDEMPEIIDKFSHAFGKKRGPREREYDC